MRAASTALILLLGLALVGDVHAQRRRGRSTRKGPVTLTAGFTPDPVRLRGRTAGIVPLNERAPGCRGYVGPAPSHVIELDSDFRFLRFFATSREPVLLALRSPDGEWSCSGRPLLGSPREQGAFSRGRYEVWIGSALPGQQVSYELAITEFRSVTPATGRSAETLTTTSGGDVGLEIGAQEGRFRGRRFRRGFVPDPRIDEGQAGGPIRVSLLGGGCRGRTEAQPNHVLELRTDFDYLRVELEGADGETSLVIRTPTGEYLCSAPDDGPARIERDAWPAGRYRIWVGSRARDATPDYRIVYSETRPPLE